MDYYGRPSSAQGELQLLRDGAFVRGFIVVRAEGSVLTYSGEAKTRPEPTLYVTSTPPFWYDFLHTVVRDGAA